MLIILSTEQWPVGLTEPLIVIKNKPLCQDEPSCFDGDVSQPLISV